MPRNLQEFCDSRGVPLHVDAEHGVISGVKILGLQSRNGRTYRPDALLRAVPLYEGAKVNVNHVKGDPFGPRDYQDRLGRIRNVRLTEGEGLFGDLHFNPRHAIAAQLAWDAEHAPENVGFSHNVVARTKHQSQQLVVEAIEKVQSVDLVADPATTRGLFESAEDETSAEQPRIDALTLEHLQLHRPDLVEAIQSQATEELSRMRATVEQLESARASDLRRQLISRVLREHCLPDLESFERGDREAKSLLDRELIESLREAADDKEVRRLVEARTELIASARSLTSLQADRPTSRDPLLATERPLDDRVQNFVESIT